MNNPLFVFIKVMKAKHLYSYIFLLSSALLWGGSFVLTKYLLDSYSPVSIIFFRLLFTSILSVALCLLFFKKQFFLQKGDLRYFLILALFEPFLYFLFETYSLQTCAPSVVSVIIATIPLFVSLVAVLFFKETFSRLNFLGVVISVLGIVVMILPEFQESAVGGWGILLAFGAVLAAVGYNGAIKKIPERYNPFVIVTWQNLLGLFYFLPLFFLLNSGNALEAQMAAFSNPQNVIYLLVLAFFCSTLAFVFNVSAIRVLGIARANVFTNFIPVATAFISFLLLGEAITLYKMAGIAIVILGIFMVQRRK